MKRYRKVKYIFGHRFRCLKLIFTHSLCKSKDLNIEVDNFKNNNNLSQ